MTLGHHSPCSAWKVSWSLISERWCPWPPLTRHGKQTHTCGYSPDPSPILMGENPLWRDLGLVGFFLFFKCGAGTGDDDIHLDPAPLNSYTSINKNMIDDTHIHRHTHIYIYKYTFSYSHKHVNQSKFISYINDVPTMHTHAWDSFDSTPWRDLIPEEIIEINRLLDSIVSIRSANYNTVMCTTWLTKTRITNCEKISCWSDTGYCVARDTATQGCYPLVTCNIPHCS